MALDPSIPLQTKVPDTVGTLSSLTNLQQARVGLARQQMAQQQDSIDLQERQGVQGVLSNIKAYQDSNGNVDMTKLAPDIMSVAPTTGADVLSKVAASQNAAVAAKQSWSNLSDTTRQRFGKIMTAMVGQSPQTIQDTFRAVSGQPEFQSGLPAIQHFWTAAVRPALESGNQKQIDDAMYRVGKMGESAATQVGMNTKSGPTVSDGQSAKVVNTNPAAGTVGAPVEGTDVTLKPGPTTGTVDATGTPGVIGAQTADFTGLQGAGRAAALADIASRNPDAQVRQEAANAAAGRPQGFIPQGLPPGQAQNIANNVDEMSKHFSSLQDQASGNQLQQGLIGNIKSLAEGAATGTGAGRKAYISGLLAALHIPGTGDEARDTDLLEKNLAQLGLATPSSSDAMRTIITAARPHGTMQKEALLEAADQLGGQIKANVAIRNALSSYKMMGDVQGYQAARQKIEQIADPRAFQFESASPEEQRKMLSKLAPEDRTQLRSKIEQLINMGLMQ